MSLKGPIDGHFLFLDSLSALLLGIGVLAPPLGVLLRYLGALGWWTSRDGVAAGMYFSYTCASEVGSSGSWAGRLKGPLHGCYLGRLGLIGFGARPAKGAMLLSRHWGCYFLGPGHDV